MIHIRRPDESFGVLAKEPKTIITQIREDLELTLQGFLFELNDSRTILRLNNQVSQIMDDFVRSGDVVAYKIEQIPTESDEHQCNLAFDLRLQENRSIAEMSFTVLLTRNNRI
jgi:hypothetical protein